MTEEKVWIEWNEFLKFLQKNRHLLPMPVTLSNESLDGLLKIDAELTRVRAEVRTLRNAGVSLLERAEKAERGADALWENMLALYKSFNLDPKCPDWQSIHAFRIRVQELECQKKALQQVNAETEGVLCRAREAYNRLRMSSHKGSSDHGVPRRYVWCDRLEEMDKEIGYGSDDPAPCPHEEEDKRLREELRIETELYEARCGEVIQLRNELRHQSRKEG